MFFLQMSGFPGSGKSTLARQIGKHTNAIIIDHDIVKSALVESLDTGIDSKTAAKASYSIEWALIDFHLSQGQSVILDSPCFYTETLENGTRLSKKHCASYKYVECYLNDIKEIENRLKKRKRMVSQIQKVSSEDIFYKTVENSKRPFDGNYLIVDSSQPLERYINEVMAYINHCN